MIDHDVMERYLSESTLKMTAASKVNLENLLIKFFGLKPSIEFPDLTKKDLIEMYSQLNHTSTNSFITHKSKINDFAKWMYEQGYGSVQLLKDISDLQFSDINHNYLYDIYYFRDLQELWSIMEMVFEDRGSEFDTFRSAAILVWLGIDLNDLPDMLKSDLREDSMTIIHPVTKENISIPNEFGWRDKIFQFLVDYKNANSCDTAKFGGRIVPYVQSQYLFRSYKSAHFTAAQLRNVSSSANRLAKEYKRVFQWNRIYLSGLYYRISQYEKEHGTIKDDMDMLEKFFVCNQKKDIQREVTYARKYNEYQEFKRCLDL